MPQERRPPSVPPASRGIADGSLTTTPAANGRANSHPPSEPSPSPTSPKPTPPRGAAATGAAMVWTIKHLLEWTTAHFRKLGLEHPALEAQALLAHVLGCARIQLFLRHEEEVSAEARAQYRELIQRRSTGQPMAYLIGEREFYSLLFIVTPAVLIPQPDTEVLVDQAKAFAERFPVRRLLDLGTGSGAVAVALAKNLPQTAIVAVDLSSDALAIAKQNCQRHEVVERIQLLEGDLFAPLPTPTDWPTDWPTNWNIDPTVTNTPESDIESDQSAAAKPGTQGDAATNRPALFQDRFDLIVSNPPYIAAAEFATLPIEVREFAPRLALAGGDDGLAIIRRLVAAAPAYLVPGGGLLIEIGATQAAAVEAIIREQPELVWQALIKDYSQLPRVVFARRRPWLETSAKNSGSATAGPAPTPTDTNASDQEVEWTYEPIPEIQTLPIDETNLAEATNEMAPDEEATIADVKSDAEIRELTYEPIEPEPMQPADDETEAE